MSSAASKGPWPGGQGRGFSPFSPVYWDPTWVLHPALRFQRKGGYGPSRASPEEGQEGNQRPGPTYEDKLRAAIVQPEEEKALSRYYSNLLISKRAQKKSSNFL